MRHKNSFDFIRFVAASLVVFSHSFALVGLPEPSVGTFSMGSLAVWIFFILSGYLISSSWEQYPRFNVYLAKRALRIFPGLIVAIFLTVIAAGLFFSNLGPWHYFTNPQTLSYLNNIFLINTQYSLPDGVFALNTYPNAVNGSIWTLAYEFLMYISVAVFGAIGIYKKISIEKIWVVLFLTQIVINIFGFQHFDFIIFYFQFNLLITLALMFFTGVLIQKKAKRFNFKPKYGVLSFLLFIIIATVIPKSSELVAATLLAYSLFALGNSTKMSWFGKYGDFSYGIYIYSFPIQQAIISVTMSSNPYKVFALSLSLSIFAGALSWRFIESKMLRLKNKINTNRYPLTQDETAW